MDKYEKLAAQVIRDSGMDGANVSPRVVENILRACDEMRAAGSGDKPVAGRPVAGEWRDGISGWGRYVGVGEMVTYADGGEWHVYRTDSSRIYREGRAPNEAAAMAAADAWARDNAHLLDWTLPPAPVQPVAPLPDAILLGPETQAALDRVPDEFKRFVEEAINKWATARDAMIRGAMVQPVAPRELTDVEEAIEGAEIEDYVGRCRSERPDGAEFQCTRRIGHVGDHIAGDVLGNPQHRWSARPPAVPQPAPSATVDEVTEVVDAILFAESPEPESSRLRAALSTLSPAQLRGMMTAIGAAK